MMVGKTNKENVDKMWKKMGEVTKTSPSMCLAKWLQTTITLYNGFTHSCHHPSPHKIPLEEVACNPSALHNTTYKKQQRQQMLEGSYPKECGYCWNIEKLKNDHISDRVYKSTDEWAYPYMKEVIKSGSKEDIAPTYLEVAFENVCNFKCAYCSPDVSSKWMDEIRRYGAYPTSMKFNNLEWLEKTGKLAIPNRSNNPYVDAFWQWWPDVYPKLKTFRITGGEPLLSKHTWKALDYILENPNPDLNLAINTNLGVDDLLIDKLVSYCNILDQKVKSLEIYTSCEAHGSAAEFIRYGLNYERFMQNIVKLLNNTNVRVNLMITFNALSVTTFKDFLFDIWNLRSKYNESDALNRIPFMIAYLRWPPFLGVHILPRHIKESFAVEITAFVKAHTRNNSPNKCGRFYLEEIDQVERLCEYMLSNETPEHLDDFKKYITEYEKRRNLDFRQIFPQLVGLLDA